MTREDAKKLSDIFEAVSSGKRIEIYNNATQKVEDFTMKVELLLSPKFDISKYDVIENETFLIKAKGV